MPKKTPNPTPRTTKNSSQVLKPSRLTPIFACLFFWSLYLLPIALFFSYHPVLSVGSDRSMNFEFSLALIWLICFDIISFGTLLSFIHTKRFPGLTDRRFFLLSLVPFYFTCSIFWSANPLRGALTAGIIWLIFFAVFSIVSLAPLLAENQPKFKNFRKNLVLSVLLSTFLVCVFCWFQSILDISGVSRDNTLLCIGCTYNAFGFPHPSGFAIEPQFMGNLLLAPTLLALFILTFRTPLLSKSQRRLLIMATILFSWTLFFTFSRGAIYAFLIALVLMLFFAIKNRYAFTLLAFIPAVAFLGSLLMQGAFAQLSPTPDTFLSGITKSIHQLTLGKVDLRSLASSESSPESEPLQTPTQPNSPSSPADGSSSIPSDKTSDEESDNFSDNSAHFDGYVAESTNVRLELNAVAFETWTSSRSAMLFGVGLGGAGVAMHRYAPDRVTSAKEIVQNEYFSLLLETGLFGIGLLLFSSLIILFPRRKFALPFTPPVRFLLLPLIVAYLVTLGFFSGLPNALQIYLMPPLFYLIFRHAPLAKSAQSPATRSQKSKKVL